MNEVFALDRLDKLILGRLQLNGRETYDAIGAQVGLSPSAVLRRVKRLEEGGVIDRYVALVRPESVGLGLTAYVNVRLEKQLESHKRNPMDLFRASVQSWPEVTECAARLAKWTMCCACWCRTWRITAASSWTPCSSIPACRIAKPVLCWTGSRPPRQCRCKLR